MQITLKSFFLSLSFLAAFLPLQAKPILANHQYLIGCLTNNGSGTVSPHTTELFEYYNSEGEPVEDDGKVTPPPATGSRTIGSFSPYFTSFRINGKTPVPDTAKKEFFVALPQDGMPASATTCLVTYTPTQPGYQLFANGKVVTSGQNITFSNVAANQSFLLEIKNGTTTLATARLYFTCLPIVQIYTDVAIQNVYGALARFAVSEADQEGEPETMNIRIRNRGGISIGYPKKSFAVKLRNEEGTDKIDRSFFNLRSDNSWILDAMYIDPGRTRNRVSTDLWNDFATLPYWSNRESNMLNGTRGQYVEVFLDDAYHGLYCMTEKIDRKQLKLNRQILAYDNNGNPVHIQRGLLYKAASWTTATMYGYPLGGNNNIPNYNNNSGSWSAYEVKYPDLAEGEPITWAPLHRAMSISSSYYTNDFVFRDLAATTFDLPVYLDYYLFLELLLATDNHGKNAYAAIYDLSASSKITITPWDLDGTWGRRWDGSNNITQATRDFDQFIMQHEHGHMNLYLRLQKLDVDNWAYKLRKRYEALRGNHFSHPLLVERFAYYFDLFNRSGASQRESARWQSLNFQNELNYLSGWIETRLAVMDQKYLGGTYTSVGSVHYQLLTAPNPVIDRLYISGLSFGLPVQLYNLQGVLLQEVKADTAGVEMDLSAYPPGIYIVRSGAQTSRIIKR